MSIQFGHEPIHRRRGHRGGLIPTHRALYRLELGALRVLASILLVLLLLVGWAFAWSTVAATWAEIGNTGLEILGVPGQATVVERDFVAGTTLDVPRFDVPSSLPDRADWWIGLVVSAVLLIASLFVSDAWTPLAYYMRLLGVLQISSQIVFALFPAGFPYDVGGMTEVSMLANMFLIGLIPLMMGFAFFPLNFGWGQRIAAVLWPALHLTVGVPLLYVGHAWILHHGSLLWMPMLFWAFGLPIPVLTLVAFYGWASSWRQATLRSRPTRPHARPNWTTTLTLLLLATGVARAQDGARVQSVQVGADLGEYTEDLGTASSAFVAYTHERTWVDRWRVDLGTASRFDDSGLGFGVSYGRHLGRSRVVTAGFSTGTGDVIFPEWRFDVALRQTGLLENRLLVDLGYTHVQSKAENSNDSLGGGLIYTLGRGFQVGVDGRIDRGSPGSTTGHTVAGSLLYGIYRRFYASVRFEVGRVAYLLVGPSDALIEFDSRGLRAGLTWYVRRDRGVGVEFAALETDVYDFYGVALRAFREW